MKINLFGSIAGPPVKRSFVNQAMLREIQVLKLIRHRMFHFLEAGAIKPPLDVDEALLVFRLPHGPVDVIQDLLAALEGSLHRLQLLALGVLVRVLG